LADSLTNRIVAALKKGPASYREIFKTLDYEGGIDDALVALSNAGKARRYTNWPMFGGERVEYWALTPSGR